MGIKKIVMLATLLTVVSGGEISAMAKTKQISKFTHVKVSKHTVSGKTTKYAHVKLTHLKYGEKVGAKADKHGKFILKVKKNNLKKLKFKLIATKKGFKSRTYKHSLEPNSHPIKKRSTTSSATQEPTMTSSSPNNSTVSTQHASSTQPTIPVIPTMPATQDKNKQVQELRSEIENALQIYFTLKQKIDPQLKEYDPVYYERGILYTKVSEARKQLLPAKDSLTKTNASTTVDIQKANENVALAQTKFDKAYNDYYDYMDNHSAQFIKYSNLQNQIDSAMEKIDALSDKLAALQPGMPGEGINEFE